MKKTEENNILIIGSDGVIGEALATRLHNQNLNVIKTSRRKPVKENCLSLDLGDPVSAYEIPENVSWAFICAGITSIEQCRLEPNQTRLVNVQQTGVLSRQLVASGARIVFLSSNVVYDGSKPYRLAEEPTCPISEYGKQKAAVETLLLALGKNVTVIRLTKVLSSRMSLLAQWVQSLKIGAVIHPRSDMILSPLPLEFVTDTLLRLIDIPYSGILQLSGAEDITYAALAYEIAGQLGADSKLVQPITRETNPPNEIQPLYSTLDTTTLRHLLKVEPPGLKDVVRSLLSPDANS